jgi:hypothetical protein
LTSLFVKDLEILEEEAIKGEMTKIKGRPIKLTISH